MVLRHKDPTTGSLDLRRPPPAPVHTQESEPRRHAHSLNQTKQVSACLRGKPASAPMAEEALGP